MLRTIEQPADLSGAALSEFKDWLGITRAELGSPRIRLVDQTSLIHIEMTGGSPEDAQARGAALLRAFVTAPNRLLTRDQIFAVAVANADKGLC